MWSFILFNFIQVKHSQRANASPALPWIILRGDGSIQTAHCNCMAGLGEVCSHAAAVTFYLAQLNHKEDLACTSMLSQWTVPKNLRDAGPVRIKHIDFGKQIKSREYIGIEKLCYLVYMYRVLKIL